MTGLRTAKYKSQGSPAAQAAQRRGRPPCFACGTSVSRSAVAVLQAWNSRTRRAGCLPAVRLRPNLGAHRRCTGNASSVVARHRPCASTAKQQADHRGVAVGSPGRAGPRGLAALAWFPPADPTATIADPRRQVLPISDKGSYADAVSGEHPSEHEGRCRLGLHQRPARRHLRVSPPCLRPRGLIGQEERPAFQRPRVRAGRRHGTDRRPRFHAPRGLSAQIGASPHLASCASIASPGSLPRNQKTAGFSRLPSFAGQAGVVEPGLHLRQSARTSDVCRAVLVADLELTQVRRVAPVGPARSARRARRSLGSGRLLFCRSRATQPRFGLVDRRSSRAGHERRHASSTAATCEATSARACPRSTPDISSVS